MKPRRQSHPTRNSGVEAHSWAKGPFRAVELLDSIISDDDDPIEKLYLSVNTHFDFVKDP